MNHDVEAVLTRELREVADGVKVPALPPLPEDNRSRSVWVPLLVAAAVLLVVLGAVAAVTALGGERELQPAPSPSPTVPTEAASDEAVLHGATDDPLRVQGPAVRRWRAGSRRLELGQGHRDPLDRRAASTATSWWGYDAEPQRIDGFFNQPPAISPSGGYWAGLLDEGSDGLLTGADTESGGEGFGGVPIETVTRDGLQVRVAAVTDDGMVITGNGIPLLCRPLVDGETVDLASTAPGWDVVDNTPAGVMARNDAGELYLVDITAEGEITPLQQLPEQNEGGPAASTEWLAWADPDQVGGEAAVVDAIWVQRIDGSDAGTLSPPQGWLFAAANGTWEDADHLIATVVDDAGKERMVRCSPITRECVLIDAP